VYEFQLPGLPDKNKVNIDLPKLNMSTVVLPGGFASGAGQRSGRGCGLVR